MGASVRRVNSGVLCAGKPTAMNTILNLSMLAVACVFTLSHGQYMMMPGYAPTGLMGGGGGGGGLFRMLIFLFIFIFIIRLLGNGLGGGTGGTGGTGRTVGIGGTNTNSIYYNNALNDCNVCAGTGPGTPWATDQWAPIA